MSKEILLVVESVANEKGVDKEIIFEALELALASASVKEHTGEEIDVRVSIDRKTGEHETFRRWTVVADDAEVEHPAKVILLSEAQKKEKNKNNLCAVLLVLPVIKIFLKKF